MLWLIPALIIGLIGAAGLLMLLFGQNDDDRTTGLVIVVVAGIVQVVFFVVMSFHSVKSSDIAVVKTFGKITGQSDCTKQVLERPPVVTTPVITPVGTPIAVPTIILPTSNLTDPSVLVKCGGMLFTWPWQTIETFNVRENYVFSDDTCANGRQQCINAGDSEQQTVFIEPKLSIKISPDNVQRLATDPGQNYVERVVRPLMESVVKDTTKNYSAIDVHLKRSDIENLVARRMQAELARYSIEVIRMNFTEVNFTDDYNKAIAEKAQQTQEALRQTALIEVEKQKQAVELAKANGEAAAAIARANGQAEANRIISSSLTPNLLSYEAIQKFVNNVQIALVPSGEGNLLDPSSFLRNLGAPTPVPTR